MEPTANVALPLSAVLQVGIEQKAEQKAVPSVAVSMKPIASPVEKQLPFKLAPSPTSSSDLLSSPAAVAAPQPPGMSPKTWFDASPSVSTTQATMDKDAALDRLISNFEAVRAVPNMLDHLAEPVVQARDGMSDADIGADIGQSFPTVTTVLTSTRDEKGTRDGQAPTEEMIQLGKDLVDTPVFAKGDLKHIEKVHDKIENEVKNAVVPAIIATVAPTAKAIHEEADRAQEDKLVADYVEKASEFDMNAAGHAITNKVPEAEELETQQRAIDSDLSSIAGRVDNSTDTNQVTSAAHKVQALARVAVAHAGLQTHVRQAEDHEKMDYTGWLVQVLKAIASLYWDRSHETMIEDEEFRDNLVNIFTNMAKSTVGMSIKDGNEIIQAGCLEIRKAMEHVVHQHHQKKNKTTYREVEASHSKFLGQVAQKVRHFLAFGKYHKGTFDNPTYIDSLSEIAGGHQHLNAIDNLANAYKGVGDGLKKKWDKVGKIGAGFNNFAIETALNNMVKYDKAGAEEWLKKHLKILEEQKRDAALRS